MFKILLIFLFLIIIYFAAVLPRLSQRERMAGYRHTMFAHRGYHCASRGIPENSIKAFRAALTHNYGIELDVHLTRDGHLVVFHDDTLTRMCGRPGTIEHMTLKELKSCRLLGTQEYIPSLEDVLRLVNGKVPLLIELKIPGHSLKVCRHTYDMLRDYNGMYLIQSFNTMGLYWFRRHAPHVLRGQLASRLTKDKTKEPWIFKFMAEYLLINFLGRPDFISYKLADLPQASVIFLRNVLNVPLAVWTLRTREALKDGILNYDMQIFEKQHENY